MSFLEKPKVPVRRASQLAGWSVGTTHNLMNSGALPFIQVRGKRYILVEDLENLLRSSYRGNPA